jgi:twitching motility protein PilT
MFDVHQALRTLVELGGSDLHLKVPAPPLARVDGDLKPLDGQPPLTPEDTSAVLDALLDDAVKREEFEHDQEVDFAFAMSGVARFRVNAFRQRGTISLVCRAIPYGLRTIEELELPTVLRDIAEESRGIVLVTGATGSGKSTTLAAMIDHLNENFARHIVTIEDPIEFLHRDKQSIVNQREVGVDTASFARAMRRVLRQDPDVILIGEMRDEETVRTALSAAETGHLVFSTLHTVDAVESINRIIDFFSPHEQKQARALLAGTLKAVISQRLVVAAGGQGRVPVCEVLRMTGRVRDAVMDSEQASGLNQVVAEGGYYGMQTFDQALYGHLKAGRITYEDAVSAATSPNDFKLLVAADGRRGTTMDDVLAA